LYDQVLFITKGRRRVRQIARRFDVFHGLAGYSLTIEAAVAAERHGLPAVVKLAGSRGELVDKPGWRKWLALPKRRRQQINELSAVVAISTAIRDELLEYGFPEGRIACIPNGVDVSLFKPCDASRKQELRSSLGLDDAPVVLFVGNVIPGKGPHLLVDAIKGLKSRNIECQLLLVGPESDVGYMAEIRDRLLQYGLERKLKWLPFVRDIASIYQAADVFVLPSRSEGMPNAMLEAMSSGLPCIGTRISGVVDLITDGVHGRLVERSSQDIANAVYQYICDQAEAMSHGAAARRRVVERFSTQTVVAAYENLFRNILAGLPVHSAQTEA